MARIRVNTEDLKNKAKDFVSAADAFNRAGDEIAALAMSMPSYDGQLSGPARKAGYEIQSQAREMKTALSGDAESLRKTAQAFEEVDNKTIDLFDSAREDISIPISNTRNVKLGFGSPDDSGLYGPFHGIWFTYNTHSWNPFMNGHRESKIGGELSSDADKWIGYEDVLGDPNKVVIWYNPLPPQPLPNPPYIPRVYDRDNIFVQAFLLAEKNLEISFKLISAYIPDIFEIGMNADDFVEIIQGIAKGGASFLKGLGLAVETISNFQGLTDACALFDTSYTDIQIFGENLFTSDAPNESYFPYGNEILEQGPPIKPTPVPAPPPPTPQTPPASTATPTPP
jgi:uncharacterized protein YukE